MPACFALVEIFEMKLSEGFKEKTIESEFALHANVFLCIKPLSVHSHDFCF